MGGQGWTRLELLLSANTVNTIIMAICLDH